MRTYLKSTWNIFNYFIHTKKYPFISSIKLEILKMAFLNFYIVHKMNFKFSDGEWKHIFFIFILKIDFNNLKRAQLRWRLLFSLLFQKFGTLQHSNSQSGKTIWECKDSPSHICPNNLFPRHSLDPLSQC